MALLIIELVESFAIRHPQHTHRLRVSVDSLCSTSHPRHELHLLLLPFLMISLRKRLPVRRSLAGQTLTWEERVWSNSHQAFVLHTAAGHLMK